MDAKEIKSHLKAAREAIRTKDFKEALKQCKAVLAVDKANYNALVFVGVAADGMDQSDQALKAYRRATTEQPDELLAWQGLGGMLDKNPKLMEAQETIDVYSHLVKLLASDRSKQVPYQKKLVDLFIKTEKADKAIEILSELSAHGSTEKEKLEANQQIIDLLTPLVPKVAQAQMQMYEDALNFVVACSELSNEDVDKYTYLFLLLQSQRGPELLEKKCVELHELYPVSTSPVMFHLQFYLDHAIGDGQPSGETKCAVSKLTKQLEELKPDCELVKIGQAFSALLQQQFSQAKQLLHGIAENSISGQYYLSQACLGLHQFQQSIDACQKGAAACLSAKRVLCVSAPHILSFFKLAEAESYRNIGSSSSQDSALALLEEVADTMPTEAFLIKAYVFLDQGKIKEAEECYHYLPADLTPVMTLKADIYFSQKLYTKAMTLLQSVMKENPDDARACLRLGTVLWELRHAPDIENVKQLCFTTLLKAAKLDPYNYESFLYLGYFYKEIQKDLGKARRCFHKAFELNNQNNEAGTALVDTLKDLGEEAEALKILQAVVSKAAAGSAKWAWLRLGLHQMKHEDPTPAIATLQSALRADPEDNHVWECLAEAYLQRGSFTASLKAFTKASELDPDSLYCRFQIANIKRTLGSLAEAIEDYKQVLGKASNYVPVLKGLGESLIQLGRQNLASCLDGLAQDSVEEAIGYLTRAASQRPDLTCLWKLLGDACLLVHCLASDCYSVPSKLMEKSATGEDMRTVTKAEMLQIGTRCYNQALKLLPDCAALWHDLGLNLSYLATVVEEDQVQFMQRADKALRKAVSMEPKEWRHWNALGVLACNKLCYKPALAQHCFIKSIECEASNVTAWSNLGTLYLANGDVQLAHDAFKAAQSVDPTYMASWIGQAMIAEIVGHEEAMDLFRHTTELGFHVESAQGYGQWVLNILGDASKRETEQFQYCIKQMAAVPAASDAMVKYTERVPTDAKALYMLALLLEHQDLFRSAGDAFTKALGLLRERDELEPSSGVSINEMKMNLARVLCKQGKFTESVNLFQECDLDSNFEHTCLYGLALYHQGQYVESFKVYRCALERAGTDEEKSQVYTALGMVAYRFQDMADAKSQLFNGFQTSQPSVHGLLALCALGILQSDLTLTAAVLEELVKHPHVGSHEKELALLHFYTCLLQGDEASGESQMKEKVEAEPKNVELLSILATVLMHRHQPAAAAQTAAAAKALTSSSAQYQRLELTETGGYLLAGQHSRKEERPNAFKAAQRAFHLNPGCVSTMSLFTCAVHAESALTHLPAHRDALLSLEQHLLSLILHADISAGLKTWCFQQALINSLCRGDLSCCGNLLKQLEGQKELSPATKALEKASRMFVQGTADMSGLSGNVLSQQLLLLMVCALLAHMKNLDQALTLLWQGFQEAEKKEDSSQSLLMLERLCHFAFLGLQDNNENESLVDTFEKVVTTVKEGQLASPVISIMHGIQSMNSNKRLAKHLFATALDQVGSSVDSGHCSSMARRGLISLLWDSSKDSDQQLVKALMEDAKASGDHLSTEMFRNLSNK